MLRCVKATDFSADPLSLQYPGQEAGNPIMDVRTPRVIGGGGNPETSSTPASLRFSSTSKSTVRWIIYKGSGGLAHMLGGLSDAIKIAKKTRRHLVIDCQSAGAFQSSFDKYFYIEDEGLSYSCSYDQIPDAAVY